MVEHQSQQLREIVHQDLPHAPKFGELGTTHLPFLSQGGETIREGLLFSHARQFDINVKQPGRIHYLHAPTSSCHRVDPLLDCWEHQPSHEMIGNQTTGIGPDTDNVGAVRRLRSLPPPHRRREWISSATATRSSSMFALPAITSQTLC